MKSHLLLVNIMALISVLLSSACFSHKEVVNSIDTDYYTITDTSILGNVYFEYKHEEIINDSVVDYGDEEIDGDEMIFPVCFRFDKDSISCQAFSGYSGFVAEKNHYLYNSARLFCSKHDFHPWIKHAYRIRKETGIVEIDRDEWFLLTRIEKITPDEIIFSRLEKGNEKNRDLIYYHLKDNSANAISGLSFCCYDSLYCYINSIEPLRSKGNPIRHDHNDININSVEY